MCSNSLSFDIYTLCGSAFVIHMHGYLSDSRLPSSGKVKEQIYFPKY
jgi:hypothetical protein